MTSPPSASVLPRPRQSPYYGVFSRVSMLWFLKDRARVAGLSISVVLQTFSLLWLWNKPVNIFGPFLPFHLLLLILCMSLTACVLYLWQIIVFHISYCSLPSSVPIKSCPPSAAVPSSFAPRSGSHCPTSRRESCISTRRVPLGGEVATSTARGVAHVSTPAPVPTAAQASVAGGAPASAGATTTTSTSYSLPRALHATLGRCVSRVKSSSRLRYLTLLWKAHRGGAVPSVEGSHVLITGGSKGIGLALAMECVRRGAALITLVARTASELEQAQTRCLAEGEACGRSVAIQILQADVAALDTVQERLHRAMQLQGKIGYSGTASFTSVTDAVASQPPQLRSAAAAAVQQTSAAVPETQNPSNSKVPVHGKDDGNSAAAVKRPLCPPRLLFCNAAMTLPSTVEMMSPAAIRRVVDTNLTSTVLQVQAVLPHMRKQQGGCICFSNTLAAQVPIYGLSVYAGTKAALAAFSSGLEQETAGTNIRFVNAYMPSVATPGFAEEKRVRPPLTGRLEGTVSVLHPEVVAARILNAIGEGKRQVTFGVDGWLVARCAAAFNAAIGADHVLTFSADTLAEFLSEVFLAGLLRAVLLGLRIIYQLVCHRHALEDGAACAERGKSKNAD